MSYKYNVSGIGKIREDIWFTSDTNFFNEQMLSLLSRPFRDVYDMNEYIIEKWNINIRNRDIVYHLGNFGKSNKQDLQEILNKLNGRINLIVGSDDTNDNILSLRNKLASVNYRLDFRIDDWLITLNHYPQRFWYKQHSGSIHLHGYVCGTVPADQYSLALDVGTDTNNFIPYNWEEIKQVMILKRDYISFQKNRVSTYL